VLEDGRVAETGTHRELIAANASYAHLQALQLPRSSTSLEGDN